MKKLLVPYLMLVTGPYCMALGLPTHTYSCQNPEGQALTIVESASKITRGPLLADSVSAVLTEAGTSEVFTGKIQNLKYVMNPAVDGKEVKLDLATKTHYVGPCGRCLDGEGHTVTQHFAKLAVANQIYNFSCVTKPANE